MNKYNIMQFMVKWNLRVNNVVLKCFISFIKPTAKKNCHNNYEYCASQKPNILA